MRRLIYGYLTATAIATAGFFAVLPTNALAFAPGDTELSMSARAERLDELFERLREVDAEDKAQQEQITDRIARLWAQSGDSLGDLLLIRGRMSMAHGNYADAFAHLTALTDHLPEFAEGWNARATLFFAQGEYGLALADIEQTLALEPRHFGALAGLALTLEALGDEKRAYHAWGEVLVLHPHLDSALQARERLELAGIGRDI